MGKTIKELGIEEPVAVLGLGVEGRSIINYLLKHGANSISALDRNEIADLPGNVEAFFGEGYDRDLTRFATIFRSPGIRPDHFGLNEAGKRGALVTSAISFFLERCKAPVIGITGTLGKGTCASLTAKMLQDSGLTAYLGGNIGYSPLDFLDDVRDDHAVVLEISSFQAMDVSASPKVCVVLKTTSEHLDWHIDLDEYLDAKAHLLAHQKDGDITVYDADTPGSSRIASGSLRRLAYSVENRVDEGIFLRDNRLILRLDEQERDLDINLEKVLLPGKFNIENISAALLAAVSLKCDIGSACRTAEAFKGLPHRIELVAEAGGIRFYNDSYATRPDATLGALSCFEGVNLALILGGSEKNADFSELAKAIAKHSSIAKICLIGATADRLANAVNAQCVSKLDVQKYDNLEAALEGATVALGKKGVVLLSPACASFGIFPNYKVRGERFRSLAKEYASKCCN